MIPSVETKILYIGNGVAKEFPFTFKFSDVADIKVAICDIATESTTVLSKDYYVDTEKNVILYPGYQPGQEPPTSEQPGILPSSKKIIIYRETPINQLVDLGGKYPMKVLEEMTDKNLMISQEFLEKLERCVMVGMGSAMDPNEFANDIHQSVLSTRQNALDAAESEANASKSSENAIANANQAASVLGGATTALYESTGAGIISGFDATISGSTINIKAGTAHMVTGYRETSADTTITPNIADATNPRIDLIYLSSAGVVSCLAGVAAASPVIPSMPSGGLALCKALVGTTGTITLTDLRGFKARYQNIRWINVLDFGATGDGITDETTVIQRAIAYATKNNKTLYFPTGTYLISKTINIADTITIIGDNASFVINDVSGLESMETMASVIAYVPILVTGVKDGTNVSTQDFKMTGISIKNNTISPIVGVLLDGAFNDAIFNSVKGYNLKNSLVHAGTNVLYQAVGTNTQGTSLSSINRFVGENSYAEYGGSGQNPALFHVLAPACCDIHDNLINHAYGYGIRVDGGSYNAIPNPDVGSRNINIHHNTIIGWGTTQIAIQVTKSNGVKVCDNVFQGLDETDFLSSDNSVDIFNCHNVMIGKNKSYNGGGLFAGHADLNSGTATNLIGTRNVIIDGNTIQDCKNNPIFIGGDGTVDADRSTKDVTISNNSCRWTKTSAASYAAIYSFLANNLNVFGNTFDGYAYVVQSYYNKYFYIHDNNIVNIPQYVNLTGSDGYSAVTHVWGKNNAIGTSGSTSGFEVLNDNGSTKENGLLRTITTTSASLSLASDCAGERNFHFNRGVSGIAFTINATIPAGVTVLDLSTIYNEPVGGGVAPSAYNHSIVHLRYSSNSAAASVTTITSNSLSDSTFACSIAVTAVSNGSGSFTITFTITAAATTSYEEMLVNCKYLCIANS